LEAIIGVNKNYLLPNIIWFNKFPNGRFANATFQFLYGKYLENLGYKVIFGSQISPKDTNLPWELFDLPDNQDNFSTEHSLFFSDSERTSGPEKSIQRIKKHFENYPGSVLCVDGYFQFDTGTIRKNNDYYSAFENNLSLKNVTNTFQVALKKYHNKIQCEYLVAIHVRRGDYLDFQNSESWTKNVFRPINLNNIVEKLQDYTIKNRISNFILYIASDDIDFCKEYFNKTIFNIVTSENFIEDDDKNHLMVDLAAMTAANMLIASNSSLSILGGMINTIGRVFWREDMNGELISFDPWSTPILYGVPPC